MTDTPDLRFGPDVSATGFTPAGIAGFSDLRPSAVVRELIQNSLDAALIEANEPCARIRFRKYTYELSGIPGIASYRSAFDLAVDAQTRSGSQRMPTQARLVVERIRGALRETSYSFLSVIDNGIGLNEQRMSALLSDGVSAKSDRSAGTFGNGHCVAIPASNLRYVLYGGLTSDGQALSGGHAVLASHRVPGEQYGRSAHGLYIASFDSCQDGVPYTFASGSAVPNLIASEIAEIKSLYGHGTAVVIPAFNNFEDNRSLWEIVSRAAACNFFQAIHDGDLIVEVEDPYQGAQRPKPGIGVQVLNSSTLDGVLTKYKDERRSGAFLAGRKANDAYRVLVQGEPVSVSTSQGEIRLSLLVRDAGMHSVAICRNGMWITDDIPRLRNAFSDRQPFQALVLLDPDQMNGFYALIQEAETPLHNKIAPRQMLKGRQRELTKALEEVRDWLRRHVPEAKSESFSPGDVLAFQFTGAEAQGPGGRQASFWGSPTTIQRPPDRPYESQAQTGGGAGTGGNQGTDESDGSGQGTGSTHHNPQQNRPTNVALPFFRVASAPDGPGKQRIHVECEHSCHNAELRVFVDENVDATCDRQTRAQAASVLLSSVSIDGVPVPTNRLVKTEHGTVGIRLGDLPAKSNFLLESAYEVPDSYMSLLSGQSPALRIEILGKRSSTADSERTDNTSEAKPDA